MKGYQSRPPKSSWTWNGNALDPNTPQGVAILLQDPNSIVYKAVATFVSIRQDINECREQRDAILFNLIYSRL